jgi:uncharacterized protein YutE (UPF0331/DUF86 family)
MTQELKNKIKQDLKKSQAHLDYSFAKVQKINLDELSEQDNETLETLESFSSRFARFSDLVISRYLRFLATENDPAFRGTLIDLLHLAEKHGWIDSAQSWRRIRELRNIAAHEYSTEDYRKLYKELVQLCSHLLRFQF